MRHHALALTLLTLFGFAAPGAPAGMASSPLDPDLVTARYFAGEGADIPVMPDAPMMRPEDDDAFEMIDDEASALTIDDSHPSMSVSDDTDTHALSFRTRSAIRDILRAQGFSEIDDLRRRGEVYIAEVTGPQGDRMRLVVDAQTGDVQGLRVLERAGAGFDRRAEREILNR